MNELKSISCERADGARALRHERTCSSLDKTNETNSVAVWFYWKSGVYGNGTENEH